MSIASSACGTLHILWPFIETECCRMPRSTIIGTLEHIMHSSDAVVLSLLYTSFNGILNGILYAGCYRCLCWSCSWQLLTTCYKETIINFATNVTTCKDYIQFWSVAKDDKHKMRSIAQGLGHDFQKNLEFDSWIETSVFFVSKISCSS